MVPNTNMIYETMYTHGKESEIWLKPVIQTITRYSHLGPLEYSHHWKIEEADATSLIPGTTHFRIFPTSVMTHTKMPFF